MCTTAVPKVDLEDASTVKDVRKAAADIMGCEKSCVLLATSRKFVPKL